MDVAYAVAPGTIPFRVLDLIGRPIASLPGMWSEEWDEVGRGVSEGTVATRWAYREGRGTIEGRPVAIRVMARALDGIVWAVGVDAPGYLALVDAPARGAPALVPVPRDGDTPVGINWISKGPDGRPYNVGVAP